MKHPLSLSIACLTALYYSYGADYVWNVPRPQWGLYGDKANWSLSQDEAAPRLPGEDDHLGDQDFMFDMGGQTYPIGSWSYGSWNGRLLAVTNGTLEVHGSFWVHHGGTDVYNGGTLRFLKDSAFSPGAGDAAPRWVKVLPGGNLEILGRFPIFGMRMYIQNGASANIDPRELTFTFAKGKSLIDIDGELSLPNGFAPSNAEDGAQLEIVLHKNGLLKLGGTISENGQPAEINFHADGGKIKSIAPRSKIETCTLTFESGSSVEIEVGNGDLDLSAASFEPDCTLLKSGDGVLILSSQPDSLIVRGGKVVFTMDRSELDLNKVKCYGASKIAIRKPRDLLTEPAGLSKIIAHKNISSSEPFEFEFDGRYLKCDKNSTTELFLAVVKGNMAWKLAATTNSCYILDGDTRYPLLNPPKNRNAFRPVKSSHHQVLQFCIPEEALQKRLKVVFEDGVVCRGEALAILRVGMPELDFPVYSDRHNRMYYIDASSVAGKADEISYTSTISPSEKTKKWNYPIFYDRFPEHGWRDGDSFAVRMDIKTKDYGSFSTNITITSRAVPFEFPHKENDVFVGMVNLGTARISQHETVTNGAANLIVGWSNEEALRPDFKLYDAAEREAVVTNKDLHFLTIYHRPSKELQKIWGSRYLGNNIGEYAGYLYQGERESRAPKGANLQELKNHFICNFMFKGRGKRLASDELGIPEFSTSGSPLASYELQGGTDFVCNELYAVGSANIAYASSESRAAAHRWGTDYWSSWLAADWQSFAIPYGAAQKADMYLAGLYQLWAMGSSLMVLESGADRPQASDYTAMLPGETSRTQSLDFAAARYRDATKRFYQFVRNNKRPRGRPDVDIAFALGNLDAYVGNSHELYAVWGAHDHAKTNSNWRYGAPEATWGAVQRQFFPCKNDALKPYGNIWLSGSPYGQCDVLAVDDQLFDRDLESYQLLVFAGWNTMTDHIANKLDRFVAKSGKLAICLPHLSTRLDREYNNYTLADIYNNGSAEKTAICGLKIASDRIRVKGMVEVAPDAPESLRRWAEAQKGDIELDVAEFNIVDSKKQSEPHSSMKVLASIGGHPLLLKVKYGDGYVYFFTAWEYPGKNKKYCEFYLKTLDFIAKDLSTLFKIEPISEDQDDTGYICYSIYSSYYDREQKKRCTENQKLYLVNVDCVSPRTVRLRALDGQVHQVTLDPCSIKVFEPSKLIKH